MSTTVHKFAGNFGHETRIATIVERDGLFSVTIVGARDVYEYRKDSYDDALETVKRYGFVEEMEPECDCSRIEPVEYVVFKVLFFDLVFTETRVRAFPTFQEATEFAEWIVLCCRDRARLVSIEAA